MCCRERRVNWRICISVLWNNCESQTQKAWCVSLLHYLILACFIIWWVYIQCLLNRIHLCGFYTSVFHTLIYLFQKGNMRIMPWAEKSYSIDIVTSCDINIPHITLSSWLLKIENKWTFTAHSVKITDKDYLNHNLMICCSLFEWIFPKPEVHPIIKNAVDSLV